MSLPPCSSHNVPRFSGKFQVTLKYLSHSDAELWTSLDSSRGDSWDWFVNELLIVYPEAEDYAFYTDIAAPYYPSQPVTVPPTPPAQTPVVLHPVAPKIAEMHAVDSWSVPLSPHAWHYALRLEQVPPRLLPQVIETRSTSFHALAPAPQIKIPVASEITLWPTPDYPIAATSSCNLLEVRPGSLQRVLPVIRSKASPEHVINSTPKSVNCPCDCRVPPCDCTDSPVKLASEGKDSNTCVNDWVESLGPSVFEALDLDLGLEEDCTEGPGESTEASLVASIPLLALCEESYDIGGIKLFKLPFAGGNVHH
ncbi:hypothetical protein BKA82DRAFT_4360586 [Pisolithus tinctorius]|nr:hypothetical protein BKA82DRAFT_4360586 [Pisolithus tinctorius]